MAMIDKLEIEIGLTITEETAEKALNILNLYLKQSWKQVTSELKATDYKDAVNHTYQELRWADNG